MGSRQEMTSSPIADHGDLCDAHAWMNSEKVLADHGHVVLVPVGDATEIHAHAAQAYLDEVLACQARDFDRLMLLRKLIWCILVGDRRCLDQMACTCRGFMKKGKCKHMLGLGSMWG